MDFVSRHTASTTDHHGPTADSAPSSSAPSAATLEEPEYFARFMVVKHSWRGRYKRILCISNMAIVTLDPSTLAVTNAYDLMNDYEGASPLFGRDENSQEFSVSVRTDGHGKFKSIKLSSSLHSSPSSRSIITTK